MKLFIALTLLLFLKSGGVQAQSHPYECRREGGHVLHIITFHPSKYAVDFIKAHNQVFGRETIESIAKRTGADIAINAGFFEIGNSQDGMPSGTLLINGQIFGLTFQKQACLIYDQQNFKIENITPRLSLKIGDNNLHPQKVNKFSDKKDIVLYSRLWGSHTLTPRKERQEIAIDGHHKVVEFSKQGNMAIPQDGFVLSLPIDYPLSPIKKEDHGMLHLEPSPLLQCGTASVVMGIPMLLQDGNINPDLCKNQAHFYKAAHARTAVGIRSDGALVIVVVEHAYQKPLQSVTLEEIRNIILKNKIKIVEKYKKPDLNGLTLSEMKEVISEELTAKTSAVGLTLPELAKLMEDLQCESAINLDGGGSSSLFFKGQVVNHTIGDQDEGLGQETLRPLSSAIIFKEIP
jgi:exopolysaccharide biosynthesis protein